MNFVFFKQDTNETINVCIPKSTHTKCGLVWSPWKILLNCKLECIGTYNTCACTWKQCLTSVYCVGRMMSDDKKL